MHAKFLIFGQKIYQRVGSSSSSLESSPVVTNVFVDRSETTVLFRWHSGLYYITPKFGQSTNKYSHACMHNYLSTRNACEPCILNVIEKLGWVSKS